MDLLFLSDLFINGFRNLESVSVHPTERFNVISGKNGSGKTNFLEAVYFFSTLRSFRTVFRKEIVGDGCEHAVLKGLFGGAAAGLKLDIELGIDLRKIKKNDKELSAVDDHFSLLPMVLFHPANMSLLQGGPKDRRRYMDRALFQAERRYPSLLSDYNRVLLSRNRLLKNRCTDKSLLHPFDVQLASLGSNIVSSRRSFIEKAGPIFREAINEIGQGIEGDMFYRPDTEGDVDVFLSVFEKSFKRDSDRGFSSRGPHADELEIFVNGRPAKKFSSQGQQRMAVLSLKVAEVMTLSNVTHRIPILLLDDISSELDRDRNRALFTFLNGVGGQVFITTTHVDHVLLSDSRKDFKIDGGCLVEF